MTKKWVEAWSVLVLAISLIVVANLRAADESSAKEPKDVLENLKFRNLGPAVGGGRVTAVAGLPGVPNIYYVGAAAGGIFKTEDGGLSWKEIFEHESTASIGALALVPSNPSVIWAGTGEANVRNDVVDGHGVYLSTDAGHSWKFMGLGDVGQISQILVDPLDPEVVYVGALGHAWGPNPDRGVFRTTDGGKTWKKVLFANDSTGVADLEMQPGNAKVLFAAMWEFRRYPWTMVDGGAGSGIYRSTDGGDTWKKLSKGLPEGTLGRIALAIAPTNPNHVYALIAAKKGMLWQSTDLGDTWTEVSENHSYDVRPFYFSKLVVAPDNENRIYFLSFQLLESNDGGKTAHLADRGVHPDHHAIWIDSKNPERIIQGNDGGVYLSTDGDKTWRFLDNLPIEQFYMVATNHEIPYTVCGGLQDNNAWCGPSSNLGGRGVSGAQWYTVAGGDGEYAVPAPSDSNVIYSDSQNGSISRLDKSTHLARYVRPYLAGVEEMKPAELKYRFNWTSPIAVSETDANQVYLGGNVIFKSADGGQNWEPISPDLTRNDKSKQAVAGGPVQYDISGAETYDTILCITLAPTNPEVIWAGTDDGLVQVTRDGGKHWENVARSIPGAPEWARVYQIGVSPFDAGTAYVTFDAHELDNRHPLVYKTSVYGKSWTKITGGLPDDAPAHVVREDPNQRGFLVLGTDTGLYYSRDDGEHWQPLKSNFPTVPVYDLKFVKASRDLVVATHGRGIFILDDVRPLEELTPQIEASDFHLFSTTPGTLYHPWRGIPGGESSGFSTPNAPTGVVIDYFLKSEIEQPKGPPEGGAERHGPVKIVITDAHGNAVATQYGPSKAGVNRFVWTMRYDGAERLRFERPPEPMGGGGGGFFGRGLGPAVLAGDYHVAVTVKGKTEEASVTVNPDPTLKIDPAIFREQLAAALEARNAVSALNDMLNRVDGMQKALTGFEQTINSGQDEAAKKRYATLMKRAKDLGERLKKIKESVYNTEVQRNAPEDSIHYLARFHDRLTDLAGSIGFRWGEAPNQILRDEMSELMKELNQHLDEYNQFIKTEVVAFNKEAFSSGAPTLYAGEPIAVKKPAGISSGM